MSVKSSTELMLYVVLTMPTLNKAYLLFIYLFITKFGFRAIDSFTKFGFRASTGRCENYERICLNK